MGIILSCLFLLLLQPAWSQERKREPNILLYTEADSRNGATKKGINSLLAGGLKGAGLNSIQIDQRLERDELLDSAAWLGAYFVIETVYREGPAGYEMDMNCYSAWDKQLIITSHRHTDQGSFRKEEILDSLDRIIPVIKTRLAQVKAQPPPGWELDDKRDAGTEGDSDNPVESQEAETPDSPSPAVSGEAAAPLLEPVRYHFSLSGAPLISTGEAASYFTTGSHVSLFGGYHFPVEKLSICLGGRLSWDHFKGKGVLTDSVNNIYYLGPEVQLGLGTRYDGRVFLSMGSGISFLTVKSEQTGLNLSPLPYISAGLGAEFPISGILSVYYSGNYTLHFEKSTVFSGFYPTLGLCLTMR